MTKLENFRFPSNVHAHNGQKCTCKGSGLDTLEQLGTITAQTSISDNQRLKKRARRKYLNTSLSLALVRASEQNAKGELTNQYWQTYHCAKVLRGDGTGKIVGRYCGKRWCMVCNAIRAAQNTATYAPIIDTWQDVYFVTLTVPNVSGDELREAISGMFRTFTRIKDRLRKRGQRGGQRFKGLRKLETTYNPIFDDYHPHFHVLVEGKEVAEDLLSAWLDTYPEAVRKAQDIRKADEGAKTELFKYFTKVLTKTPDGETAIYADAMDIIFNAVSGMRIFQPFGFKAAKEMTEAGTFEINQADVNQVFEWQDEIHDWVDTETGELLTDYTPGDKFRKVVEKGVIIRKGYVSFQRSFAIKLRYKATG